MSVVIKPSQGSTGLIVLANPRTGSQATRNALRSMDLAFPCGGHHDKIDVVRQRLLNNPQYQQQLQADPMVMPTCVTVRNHYDAFATWFQVRRNSHGPKNPRPFAYPTMSDFIQGFSMPQYGITENRMWGLHPDTNYVHRYENLRDELNMTLSKCNIEPLKDFPKVNVTKKKKPYQEYYTKNDIERMKSRSGQEMDELGYTFER